MWNIVGQTRAVSLLQRSLEKGSLSHAYLFVGPAHVGKMTLALNLAQALNCEASAKPCGECASCQRIAAGIHPDVQTIGLSPKGGSTESQTEISIDQIRQIQHSASLPPFEGRHRAFIIDGAEFLSIEAANCLLKTLEEPADKVIFLLLTATSGLPSTVVSRCQRVELFPVPVAEIETALTGRVDIQPAKAALLARISHGCPGWAISAAFNGILLQQRTDYLDELTDMIDADGEERFGFASRRVAQLGQNRRLIQERLDLWVDWWRDLLLVKTGAGETVSNIDRRDVLIDLAHRYSLHQIRDFIENLRIAGNQLRLNANPQLVLEVLMLSLP
ncbi:MAG: DNA polymerase III subunit delta' [Chloroflexi bacterium]|nr:DNA polymerase III subunit delta' [Chloroflexota bacterium]